MFKKWFRRKQSPRSLDDLIFDIAEYHRTEDLEQFCSRVAGERFYIPLEQPLPASMRPGEQLVTTSDVELRTRFAQIAGKNCFLFFTSARHQGLGNTHAEVAGIDALRMTTQSADVHGALFQNAHESWLVLDKQKISNVLALVQISASGFSPKGPLQVVMSSDKDDEYVTVPPNHKVITYNPSSVASLHQADSGFWILNFGDGRDQFTAIEAVERFVATAENQNVIWILHSRFLDSLPDSSEFIRRVRSIAGSSHATVGHSAVFSLSSDRKIMQAFKEAGIGVFFAATDGCCFVEVHRPDGIDVGIPGSSFS
jgi:hypothetical protein